MGRVSLYVPSVDINKMWNIARLNYERDRDNGSYRVWTKADVRRAGNGTKSQKILVD